MQQPLRLIVSKPSRNRDDTLHINESSQGDKRVALNIHHPAQNTEWTEYGLNFRYSLAPHSVQNTASSSTGAWQLGHWRSVKAAGTMEAPHSGQNTASASTKVPQLGQRLSGATGFIGFAGATTGFTPLSGGVWG